MEEKEFKKLLYKYLEGSLSKEEASLLERFDKKMQSSTRAVFRSEDHRLQLKKSIQKEFKKDKKKFYTPFWRVAVSIAIFISLSVGAYFLFQDVKLTHINYITKNTQWGQKSNITLSDGTKIKMNSGSSLIFPERFEGDTREVILKGEAFFDVAKNPKMPFKIVTKDLTTTVLGTSFNINAYDTSDTITVTGVTGKVEVQSEQQDKITLIPSQQAIYSKYKMKIAIRQVDVVKYMEWKDGIIRFEDIALGEAMKKLEKWFNVSIDIQDKALGQCRFSGKFNNERLNTILRSLINLKSELKYEYIAKNKIQIKGHCN